MNIEPVTGPPAPARSPLTEVKYSLPVMLEEIKAEREASVFAMEQLDQGDIGKLFKGRGPRATPQR